jgi:hypothetical protein
VRRYGAGDRLARTIREQLARPGLDVRVEAVTSRSWTSITFAGERHAMRLSLDGDRAAAALAAWLEGLGDREIELPGHLVVDISIVSDERAEDGRIALGLDAITVESR